MGGTDKIQAFTSIGKVLSDTPYQVEQHKGFSPWRVDVEYLKAANIAKIHPLLEVLDLTRGRGSNWGMAVRSSKVKATDADLLIVSSAMGVTVA